MLVHLFQIILNFLCVCQSVSWLTSLLKLDKCRDTSSSGWDIFLKFFGDIPGTLVHYFPILLNSVSWLTSLLKLDKYRDILRSGWDIFLIFWRYSWDVGTLATNHSESYVCLFVCLSVYFLTKNRKRDIILNFLYVCQSVCLLTSLPKLDKGISSALDEISFRNI